MLESITIDHRLDPALEGLEPALFWKYFNELRQIPRASGKEEKVQQYVLDWARGRDFKARQDAAGNIAIHVPATHGYEDAPPMILQAHLDMVCDKEPGSRHNFDTDPIQLERYGNDGEFIKAKGTTLGTDNGSAVSTFMAIADDETAVHPALEILFTVEEESTLRGAEELDPSALELRGQHLINLDTSDVRALCIGCAGIVPVEAILGIEREQTKPAQNGSFYEISLTGLEGGHSGDDIGKPRGNAILLLNELLQILPQEARLVSFNGGEARNIIPRDAQCILFMPHKKETNWQATIESFIERKKSSMDRPQIAVTVRPLEAQEAVVPIMKSETHQKVTSLLGVIPNGPLRMSEKIPGLVATSSNIGKIRTEANRMRLNILVRGAVTQEMQRTAADIANLLAQHEAATETSGAVPSWDEDPETWLVRLAQSAHEKVMGTAPNLLAFHSCVECGAVANRFPNKVQAVSMGPDNLDEHSPMERINIRTQQLSYERLKVLLREIAHGALAHA